MPPRDYYKQRKTTTRPSKQRQQEQRRDVREQARQPDRSQPSQRQPGLAGSVSAKKMAPALKANRLEKEFKTASDDRKEQIVSELKDTRSELNQLNREQAVLDLRGAAAGAGTPGLVARDSSGNIITDSSGNPIMTGRGSDVFQQGRQGFRDEAGRLLQESPELYRQMYPMAYAAQKGIPALMEYMPGLGMPLRIARSALGKARGLGQGIMGTRLAQDLTGAPRGFLGDVRSMFGGLGNLFNRGQGAVGNLFDRSQGAVSPAGGQVGGGGGQQLAYQPELPASVPVRQEETTPSYQGVIGGMPGMYQPGYGGSIGKETEVRTADFRDSDGDGVDDRDQSGPGQPHWRGSAGQGQKFANMRGIDAPGGSIMSPMAPSALTPGSALAMSPITQQLQFQQPNQQPNANWQQWYQNVGRFS